MRAVWKLVGGTSVVGCGLAILIVSHSSPVSGETASVPTSAASAPPTEPVHVQDPNQPYPLGPHPIEYEALSAADKAAVDAIHETVDTSQLPSSYEAWSQATAWTGQEAEAEIAARGVGLVGTAEDGVVP